MARAYETHQDALILIEHKRYNSAINRLYYAAFYAVSALLLAHDLSPTTHNGTKSNFSKYFIASEKIALDYGKVYSQLFTWRQKGDYSDLFDFTEEKVKPYMEPVKDLIDLIESMISN
jgi:uncharacterized protein (UPF0332 family)